MLVPSLVKIHLYLRKLSPENEITDGRTAVRQTAGRTDTQTANLKL